MSKDSPIKLKEIYKVLNVLKTNKFATCGEISAKINLNTRYVVLAIKYLKNHGYNIETVNGSGGGYIYHWKETIKIKNRALKKVNNGICDLYQDGVSISDIKEITNRSKEAIYYNLKKNNIKPYRKPHNEVSKYIDVKSMYENGMSIKEIADELNVSYKYASSLIYRFVKGNRRKRIDRNAIKKYIKENPDTLNKNIAEIFGISLATVFNIKKEMKKDG